MRACPTRRPPPAPPCRTAPARQALVDLHGSDEGLGGRLTEDEVQIICGALGGLWQRAAVQWALRTSLD
jgi:hypothetical protein